MVFVEPTLPEQLRVEIYIFRVLPTVFAGLFSFRFFLCNLSQVLIFCNMQMSRDFSRDICYTSP